MNIYIIFIISIISLIVEGACIQPCESHNTETAQLFLVMYSWHSFIWIEGKCLLS